MAILPGAQHPASGLEADAEGRAGEETALRRFWGFRGVGPALGELEAEVSDDSTSRRWRSRLGDRSQYSQ